MSWMFDSSVEVKSIENLDWDLSVSKGSLIDLESDPGQHSYTDIVQKMLGNQLNQLEAMALVGFNPLPAWMLEGVVLVLNYTDESTRYGKQVISPVPSNIIEMMLECGIPVKAVRLIEEKIPTANGKGKVVTKVYSKDAEGEMSHIVVFPSAKNENGRSRAEIPSASLQEFKKFAAFVDGKVAETLVIGDEEHLTADFGLENFSSMMSAYTLSQLKKIPVDRAAEFIHIFANKKGGRSWAKHIARGPMKDKYGEHVTKIAAIDLFGYNKRVEIGFKSKTDVRVEVISSTKGFSKDPSKITSRRIRFNKAMTIDGQTVPAYIAALQWALTLLGGRKEVNMKQFTGYEAGCSALWVVEDDTYGRRPEGTETLRLMHDYSCKSLDSGRFFKEVSQRYPFFVLKNGRLSTNSMSFFMNQGVPVVPDKQLTSTVYFGPGAEAQGVRLVKKGDDYHVTSLFEVAPPKGPNRLSQAFGGSKADSEHPLRPIEESPLGFETSVGVSKQKGIKVRVALTNSAANPGSGPALANRNVFDPVTGKISGFAMPYAVKRTEQTSISAYQVPKRVESVMRQRALAAEGSEDNWMVYLIPEIVTFIKSQDVIGKTFKSGEIVLNVWSKNPLNSVPVINIKGKNQTLRLDGIKVYMDAQYNNKINIDAAFMMVEHDCNVKLRGMGIKATTLLQDYTFFAEDESDKEFVETLNDPYTAPEVLFPFETIKSIHAAALCGFVDDTVAKFIESGTPVGSLDHPCILVEGHKLVFNFLDGNDENYIVDLTELDNEFYQWKENNTKNVWIEYTVAQNFFEHFKAANEDNEELWNSSIKDVEYFDVEDYCEWMGTFTSRAVRFKIYTQVLTCNLYLNVEVSTAREQGARKQSKLAEEMAVTSTINFSEGMSMWEGAKGIRSGINSVIKMLTDSPSTNMDGRIQVDLNDSEIVQDWIFEDTKEGVKTVKGRELFYRLDKMYPEGIVFNLEGYEGITGSDERKSLLIIPNAMLQVGNFDDSGSADGLVQDIVNLIYAIAVAPEDRGDAWLYALKGHVAKIRASWKSWAGLKPGEKATAQSASLLKKAGRSNPLEIPCKVMTSWDTFLDNKEGELPVMAVHPDDDNVKQLLQKALLEVKPGESIIVKVTRVPMIMGLKCQLRVTKKAKIAYGMLSPLYWSASNEGDADGDGMSYGACFKDTLKQALDYNNSVNSFMGYFTRYGRRIADTPFADFVSLKDAWSKKLQNPVNVGILNGVVKAKAHKPVIEMTSIKNWKMFADDIQYHYQRRVGSGYGCASIASFMLAEAKYRCAIPVFGKLVSLGIVKQADLLEKDGTKGEKFFEYVSYLFNCIDGNELLPCNDEIVPDEQYTWSAWFSSIKSTLNKYERLANVTWRTTYEDKGLAGFKPSSRAFFQAIDFAVQRGAMVNNRLIVIVDKISYNEQEEDFIPVTYTEISDDEISDCINSGHFKYLDEYLNEKHGIDKDLVDMMVNIETLRSAYRRLENRGYNSACYSFGEELVDEAVMYGAARRCTQGIPGVDYVNERMDKSVSTFTLYPNSSQQFKHMLMKDMVEFATGVHQTLKNTSFAV